MKEDISTFDIERVLRIARGKFREWVDGGFVSPSVPASGQGTRASFRVVDVYGVALFRRLLEGGFDRANAGRFVKGFVEKMKQQEHAPAGLKTEITYIMFKVSADGKNIVSVDYLGPGAWKLDLELAEIDWRLSNPSLFEGIPPDLPDMQEKLRVHSKTYREKESKAWSALHIINFGLLRQEVDTALARL